MSRKKKNFSLIKDGYVTIIAGPCAIESWEQLDQIAKIHYEAEEGLIWRRDLKPTITVQATVAPGVTGNDVTQKIYDNLSKISNVDDELKPELRNRLKGLKPDELSKYPISENSFYKGLQYSVYSEKEAAMTMIRSLIDGNVSSKVLNRFNSEEMYLMKRLRRFKLSKLTN